MSFLRHSTALVAVLGLFFLFGVAMFWHAFPRRTFTEEAYIYDLIWLDAWAVAYLVAASLIWYWVQTRRCRAWLEIAAFSWFGAVAVALIFAGTPLPINALGGDELFRVAMILKFKTFLTWHDFYFKDLPSFYPPLYYWILGVFARLASVEAFHAAKLGSIASFLIGPSLLYLLWRRVTGVDRALAATVFTFLFVASGNAIFFTAPHAFVGNALFIPWWFHFVEQVGPRPRSRLWYLAGGLIGAAIFMVYFYPFFVGALILLLRLLFGRLPFFRGGSRFRWRPALTVLGLAAVFSAVYWCPLLMSLIAHGMDRSRGGWHQLGSTGLLFKFIEFSMPGFLFLAALLYSLRQRTVPLWRALSLLALIVVPFVGLASVLGALDRPINLIKSREFLVVIGGPAVGLFLATLTRVGRRRRTFAPARNWRPALLGLALLVMVSGMVGFGKHSWVRVAREQHEPDWNLPEDKAAREGAVYFTSQHALYCRYPVYAFFFANEHYVHPAAQYIRRYHFLELLQASPDSYSFYIGLRFNRFDRVDYFMPTLNGDNFEFLANLSNYPNGLAPHTLRFPVRLVDDSTLFVREGGELLYRLADLETLPLDRVVRPIDSTDATQSWYDSVKPYLTPEGDSLMAAHLTVR